MGKEGTRLIVLSSLRMIAFLACFQLSCFPNDPFAPVSFSSSRTNSLMGRRLMYGAHPCLGLSAAAVSFSPLRAGDEFCWLDKIDGGASLTAFSDQPILLQRRTIKCLHQ